MSSTFSGDNRNSKKVQRALTSCTVCPLSLSCPSTGFVQAANAIPGIKHGVEVISLLKKYVVIKGDSESTRSSRA